MEDTELIKAFNDLSSDAQEVLKNLAEFGSSDLDQDITFKLSCGAEVKVTPLKKLAKDAKRRGLLYS